MENWLLSDKDKNYDVEQLVQNNEQFFETVSALFKSKDEKNIGKLCSKLTNLYKDKDGRVEPLIVDCIPILLEYYFKNFYDEKLCSLVEVCLLTIYNLSLSDDNVKQKRIRVANLSLPSVYHSPLDHDRSELSESSLNKLDAEHIIPSEDDQFQACLDTIVNSEKRFNMIVFLLKLFYSRINLAVSCTRLAKLYFCNMALKMSKINRAQVKIQPIYFNSRILCEILHSLYYLFNNGLELDAYIAIEAISQMAEDECFVDVILTCNSIKNLIQQNKQEPQVNANFKSNRSSSVVSTSNSSNTNKHKKEPGQSHTQISQSVISSIKKGESSSSSPKTKKSDSFSTQINQDATTSVMPMPLPFQTLDIVNNEHGDIPSIDDGGDDQVRSSFGLGQEEDDQSTNSGSIVVEKF